MSWVNYLSSWHTDDFKKSGGWSLERIDPANIGDEDENWSSSTNKNGGTPGAVNSIRGLNLDVSIPKLLKVIPITDDSLMLYFSEPVNATNGSLSMNEDDIKSLNIIPIRPLNQQVAMKLNHKMDSGKIYTMASNDNFHDFGGNVATGFDQVRFALPTNALASEIVFNEVLFNAKTACPEFVELFNPSDKTFNLKNYQFATLDDAGKIRNPVAASNEDYLLLPQAYAVLTDEPKNLALFFPKGNQNVYIKMSLPTLSNDGAHLVLFDNKGNWIDDFAYSPKMHSDLLADQSGVSLERHSDKQATNDLSNWSSAASQVGFATPGYKNSQTYDRIVDSVSTFTLSPKVFSPDRDGNEHQLTISIMVEQAGYSANIYIYDSNGLLLKRLAKHELLGTVNNWTWEGTDENGLLQKQGVYIIAAELSSTSGDVRRFKKACILARQF